MELRKNTEVYFDDLTHTYLRNSDNKELIGVTTLMKMMELSPDYSAIDPQVLENAARRGSAVHHAIEIFCKGRWELEHIEIEPEFMDEVLSAMANFRTTGIVPVANEYLVSDNEMVASSIDIVAEAEGGVNLIDIKTTSEVHKDAVAWQLSIYKWLFNLQNPDIKVQKLYALHLRDGKCRMIEVSAVPEEEVLRMLSCFRNGDLYTQSSIAVTEEISNALERAEEYELAIQEFERRIKAVKEVQEKAKSRILEWMKKNNLKKWKVSERLSFTYIEPTTRQAVDSTRLKKEQPEIYAAYLKESQVKESLRINLKY